MTPRQGILEPVFPPENTSPTKTMADHAEKNHVPSVVRIGQWDSLEKGKVHAVTEEYSSFFDPTSKESLEARKKEYAKVTNHYYDLVTDFYE